MRTLLLTLVAILALALMAACDGDEGPPLTQTPDANPSPGASATPSSGAIELTVGDPIPLPEDLALIISTGCWQCDGPTESFVRLRRTPDEIEQRVIFGDRPSNGSLTGLAYDADTGSVAVGTCAPNCSGLGELTGTEQTLIHLSTDGGATFTASEPLDGWFSVLGYDLRNLLVAGPFDADDVPNPVRVFPGLEPIVKATDDEWAYPMDTGVMWLNHDQNTLRSSDGTKLYESPAGYRISEVTSLDESGNRVALLLYDPEPASESDRYLLSIVRREEAFLSHERTLAGPFIHAGAALDRCIIVANVDLPPDAIPTPDTNGAAFTGFLPALIDICEGVIHPIADPFSAGPYLNGRNLITAVQRGPFRSVPDDIGDCLNVRESPSTDAPSLGCFAAGVLLRDLEESQDVGGTTWRRVATPAGDEGWASAEFLAP